MRKIIHLSDLHVGSRRLRKPFDDLVQELLGQFQPGSDYVVAITGDIVDYGYDEEDHKAGRAQLDRLIAAGFEVVAVPGNHDYGTGSGPACWPTYNDPPRFSGYHGSHFQDLAGGSLPILKPVDEIAFVLLDSMQGIVKRYEKAVQEGRWDQEYDQIRDPDFLGLKAKGELGEDQLRAVGPLLAEAERSYDYTVVMLHHHPFRKKILHGLMDGDFEGVMKRHRVDALLFGHNHGGYCWNRSWNIKRVYDAGSSTGKRDKPGPIRAIDLTAAPNDDLPGIGCNRYRK